MKQYDKEEQNYVQTQQPGLGYSQPPQYQQQQQQQQQQVQDPSHVLFQQQQQNQPGAAPNVAVSIPGQPPVTWMIRPEPIPGVQPGLEYLSQCDQFEVVQHVRTLQLLTDWDQKEKFSIMNQLGQQIYFASEESETCERQCCGPQRGFIIHILDNFNQEVIRITREFKCCAGCCWCASSDGCAHEVVVESPPGTVVGHVRQKKSGWVTKMDIQDTYRESILQIEGPFCVYDCFLVDDEFKVLTKEGDNQIGSVVKKRGDFVRQMYTTADRFSISFPMDLSVNAKATLIGALFLIDFMYFEQQKK